MTCAAPDGDIAATVTVAVAVAAAELATAAPRCGGDRRAGSFLRGRRQPQRQLVLQLWQQLVAKERGRIRPQRDVNKPWPWMKESMVLALLLFYVPMARSSARAARDRCSSEGRRSASAKIGSSGEDDGRVRQGKTK